MNFLENFQDSLIGSLKAFRDKSQEKALHDLNKLICQADNILTAVTGDKYALGLLSWKSPDVIENNLLGYSLWLVAENRTKRLVNLDYFLIAKNGHYPILVCLENGQIQMPLGDLEALEARFLAHAKTPGGPLIYALGSDSSLT